MDLSALCILVNHTPDQICRYAMDYSRFVSAVEVDFEIGDVTVRKRGKGKLAKYQVSTPPSL